MDVCREDWHTNSALMKDTRTSSDVYTDINGHTTTTHTLVDIKTQEDLHHVIGVCH